MSYPAEPERHLQTAAAATDSVMHNETKIRYEVSMTNDTVLKLKSKQQCNNALQSIMPAAPLS